jgi:hypothetical protein
LRTIKNEIEYNENLPTSDKKENVFTQNINMPLLETKELPLKEE